MVKRNNGKNGEFRCPNCGKSSNQEGIFYPPNAIYFVCCAETLKLDDEQSRAMRIKMARK